jgi:hypothetical protein
MTSPTPAPETNPLEAIQGKLSCLPEILATIESENVQRGQLAQVIQANIPPDQLHGFLNAPEKAIKEEAQRFAESEVERLLCKRLASKAGFNGSADDVKKDFEQWLQSIPVDQKKQFEDSLSQRGSNMDEYRNAISQDINQQDRLATSQWLQKEIYTDVQVSDHEIDIAYKHWKDEKNKIPDAVKVAHIPFRHDKTPAGIEQAAAKAKAVSEKITAGADFSDMVKENPSSDGHLAREGVLDFFKLGTYNEQFEAACFALKVNEVSPVIETAEGFELIKLLDTKAGTVPPLSEVEAKIKESLSGQKASEAIGKVLIEKKDEYNITILI